MHHEILVTFHQEILVKLKDAVSIGKLELKKEVVPRIPSIMYVGETVHYKSDDGTGNDAGMVEIEFPDGSPFRNPDGSVKTTITSKDPPLELKESGKFPSHCFITVRYGWGPNYPDAGGNHDVR
jgi:hypothetical protein